MSEFHATPPGESVSDEDTLKFIDNIIDSWVFEDHTDQDNSMFLLNIAHWSLEAFGQPYSSSTNTDNYTYALFPRHDFGEGFEHAELPESLQGTVFTESYGNIYVGGNNSIKVFGTYRKVEEPPYVPKWDELTELGSFVKMIEAARSDPEIMAMIMPGKFYITPAVEMKFEPDYFFKWGLKYEIWPDTVRVIPYGDYGKTEPAFNYAVSQLQNSIELMETVRDLIKLANKHARRLPKVDAVMFDILEARLDGRAGIPIDSISLPPSPGNSMKSLLVSELMKPEPDSPNE